MLAFHEITLDDKRMVDGYFRRYGEGSCQHSFVSMYCMERKYGDRICELDGYLYIVRSGRCSAQEQVCLFPMGARSGMGQAIERLRRHAHDKGAALRFETLTRSAAETLEHLFPGEFEIAPCRDYAEYLYTREKLAELPGS